MAYAEAGDLAQAVKYPRRVIELVPQEEREHQREMLRRFEARKPFHEGESR